MSKQENIFSSPELLCNELSERRLGFFDYESPTTHEFLNHFSMDFPL